ncbi:MAG: DUF6252 family protein [Ferruginibacter sp.]
MKLIHFVILCLAFFGCKKNADQNSNSDLKGKIIADITRNGESSHFEYLETIGYTFRYVANYGEAPYTSIYVRKHLDGSSTIYEEISMVIPDSIRGTFSFGPSGTESRSIDYRLYNSSNDTYTTYSNDPNVSSGLLTIDSISHDFIKGSFNVTCWNGNESAVLTNGEFWGTLYH